MSKQKLPAIAIIGCPNVGKSALFNRLMGKRIAIVEDIPGVTRDRNYGQGEWNGKKYSLIDTGGFVPHSKDIIEAEVREQAEFAIREADAVIFVVDAKIGFIDQDIDVANLLRKQEKPVFLAVNKMDNPGNIIALADFYKLGLGEPYPMSAIHGHGVAELLDEIIKKLPEISIDQDESEIVKIAIVGRPNVGKSSLLNQVLGEKRTIVTDKPGTTRDAIDTELMYNDRKYLLIDTAGVRRKARVSENVEYYSVTRAMQAIRRSDIAALVIDAADGITAQDAKLAGYIAKEGISCMVIVNKWDLVEGQVDEFLHKFNKEKKWEEEDENGKKSKKKKPFSKTEPLNPVHLPPDRGTHISRAMQEYQKHLDKHLYFLTWAPVLYTCALTGQRILNLLDEALDIMEERKKRIPTGELNDFLEQVVHHWHPPEKYAKAVKLLYMTQTDTNPPHFTLFVNLPKAIPEDYVRYIMNNLRERFGFRGTPITMNIRARKKERMN